MRRLMRQAIAMPAAGGQHRADEAYENRIPKPVAGRAGNPGEQNNSALATSPFVDETFVLTWSVTRAAADRAGRDVLRQGASTTVFVRQSREPLPVSASAMPCCVLGVRA